MAQQTIDMRDYYANLLIKQYIDKPRAYATIQAVAGAIILPQVSVQVITFDTTPTAGSFVVAWHGSIAAAINYNDSEATVRSKIAAIMPGIATAGITGSPSTGKISVVFAGVSYAPPQDIMRLSGNSLVNAGAAAVNISAFETDKTIPQAVIDGFDPATAVGVQLDIVAKYIGVSRTGQGFSAPITLNDADLRTLMKMGIIKNQSNSDLASIQTLLHQFFPGQVMITDYRNMRIAYQIDQSLGSTGLLQLFVTEGLLPRPMGVSMGVVSIDTTKSYFAFRSYYAPAYHGKGFNSYASYDTNAPWLSYSQAIISP